MKMPIAMPTPIASYFAAERDGRVVVIAQWLSETSLMRRTIRRLLAEEKPDRGQLGKHRVVVSETGLVESTAAAHMIPKRAFSSVQEAEALYQLARAGKETAP